MFGWLRVADELAVHLLYGGKGSSGIRPCLLCANVFDGKEVRGIVATDQTGLAVHHAEPDSTKLVPIQKPPATKRSTLREYLSALSVPLCFSTLPNAPCGSMAVNKIKEIFSRHVSPAADFPGLNHAQLRFCTLKLIPVVVSASMSRI